MSDSREGIVLFAHGSRDPQWALPFQRIASSVSAKLPGRAVQLAYLEQMKPSLAEAIAALAARGLSQIRIVPVFLGQGGHMKEDLPRLVAALRKAHPGVAFELDSPIGEQPAVVEAIASAIAG